MSWPRKNMEAKLNIVPNTKTTITDLIPENIIVVIIYLGSACENLESRTLKMLFVCKYLKIFYLFK